MRTHRTSSRPARLTPLVLWLGLLPVAGAEAKEYMTPEFLNRTARPMTLAALPPHAEFIKAQAVMTAEMVKEAAALEIEANKAVAEILEQKGYQVRVIVPQDFETTPGLKEVVHRINARYDEEWAKAMRKPKEARKGRYSIGEDAVEACALLKVDGLVVSRVVAVGHTGGKQALTIILSLGQAYAQSYARLSLSVIEGRTGRVEGHFTGMKSTTLGGLTKKPEKVMAALVSNAIDDYPDASEVKVAKGAPQQTEAEAAASAASDDAAIADFEAMLAQKEAKTAQQEGVPPEGAPAKEGPDAPPDGAPGEPPSAESSPPAEEPAPDEPPPAEDPKPEAPPPSEPPSKPPA